MDSNLFVVAGSRFEPGWELLAVYRDGTMVGMVAVGTGEGACVIEHFMIDARFQGGGIGRAALLSVLDLIRKNDACRGVKLGYWPGNPAVGLYESVGFRHTGERWGNGEPVMVLGLA